jgi:hypothetical protein
MDMRKLVYLPAVVALVWSLVISPAAQGGSFEDVQGDVQQAGGDAWSAAQDDAILVYPGQPGCVSAPDDANAACVGDEGCPCPCPDGNWNTAAGWFNRILGPACPRVIGQYDALMLWQGNSASRPLLNYGTLGPTAIDANDAGTPMSTGMRFGLLVNLDNCYAVEGNYLNVGTFNGNVLIGQGTYTPIGLPSNFDPIVPGTAELLTDGRIQSAELNWRRRECWCPVTWLAGFRWVQWNQGLVLASTAPNLSAQNQVSTVTGNDLYGGQVGMDVGLWNSGNWFTLNGIGKAGVFYNNAYQRTGGILENGTPWGPLGNDTARTAFFGELGLNATLAVTEWLAWRVGYSLFWLGGVAVPANQLNLVDPSISAAGINTSGSVFLHGVSTGIETRW